MAISRRRTPRALDKPRGLREHLDHLARTSPARMALLGFAVIILFFTSLLLLPFAKDGPGRASVVEALFTATSATCVTGLSVVDTQNYWTIFGHVVIIVAVQVGGLGVMTLASVLGLAVSRHIGLTQRILAARERGSSLGELGSLLKGVVITSFSVEGVLTVCFFPSFASHGGPFLYSLGHSMFMAVSTFNNAGFIIFHDGLEWAIGDWLVCIPLILGTMVGAIGFPVVQNIATNWRSPKRWSLNTKITLVTYMAIWVVAVIGIGLLEWNHAFGSFSFNDKLAATLVHATTPRSTGIAMMDLSAMSEGTWFFMDGLMFIGAGAASTGGGIKVTTFAVLVLAIFAEARGDRDTEVYGKRLPPEAIRLAISAAFLGTFLVGAATMLILELSGLPLSQVLFETISAFATCGLTTGITGILPASAQVVLVVLMYLGRVGTMTFAAALALRSRRRVIRLPEDQPIIG